MNNGKTMELIGASGDFAQRRTSISRAIDLCRVAGLPTFRDRVMDTLLTFLDFDHYAAYLSPARGSIRFLASGGGIRGATSAGIAKAYVTQFANSDPIHQAVNLQAPETGAFVARITSGDVPDNEYRRICYDHPHFTQRITVGSFADGEWQMLNLYRFQDRAPFTPDDFDKALDAGACVLPVVPVHAGSEPLRERGPTAAAALFAERLSQLPCKLSPREIEVCARALIGMTAEATALDLGVAVTSVITYRKRAYQRLGITSQNELFAALPGVI